MGAPRRPPRQLVLASGSAYKRALLARLGLRFEVCPAGVDERPFSDEAPQKTATRLARAKAGAVAGAFPGAWIIGADQVIALGAERFSKPQTPEQAQAQLSLLSGQAHQLITAVAVLAPTGEIFERVVEFKMTMRALTRKEIADYIVEDRPLDCAGSYKVEAGGVRLFESMLGDDHTAIVGLPLTRVQSLLEQTGYFR